MSGPRRGAAIAVTLAAAVAAGVALGSALDRASATAPSLAAIPPALRAESWRVLALAALQRGDRAGARAAAERAVRADPLDARSSSALGLARLAAGDGAGSADAFRVAGRLGWRDRATQLYWALAALQASDQRVAAERTDALLRQDPAEAGATALLAAIGATPAGRRALAERLAERPPWFGGYWDRLEGLSAAQLEARAAVLREPELGAERPRCDQLRALSTALAASSPSGPGLARLRTLCAGLRGGGLDDGGFERAQLDAKAPYGWQFVGEGGLDLRLEPVAGFAGRALRVSSALPVRRVFATQMIELASGRYRLSGRARGAGVAGLVARLGCEPGSGDFVLLRGAGDARFAAGLEVPADCPRQWLELAIDPDAGATVLDDLALARDRRPSRRAR